jgi:hypothetical protein
MERDRMRQMIIYDPVGQQAIVVLSFVEPCMNFSFRAYLPQLNSLHLFSHRSSVQA